MTDWSEYQDDISDAISESVDIDWNAGDGARAVVRWLNENVSLTASANDALALRTMLDNLVIAQGLSKEIREHATDAARSYLYNTRAMLSAAPAPEGGAVRRVHIARASGTLDQQLAAVRQSETYKRGDTVLCWVNEGDLYANPSVVFEDLSALATREEAPAEAGERGVAGVIMDGLWPILGSNHMDAEAWNEIGEVVSSALRAQPPAREDAQPVAGMRVHLARDKNYGHLVVRHWCGIGDLTEGEHVFYTHPDPDALRAALADLIENAVAARGCGLKNDPDGIVSSALFDTIMNGRAALAALQTEQGAK